MLCARGYLDAINALVRAGTNKDFEECAGAHKNVFSPRYKHDALLWWIDQSCPVLQVFGPCVLCAASVRCSRGGTLVADLIIFAKKFDDQAREAS